MKLKLDLHVHSSFSHDGFSTIEQLARRAKELGLDGFALTDHDTVAGHAEAERAAKREGIIIIPGEEVKTAKGDMLALGITKLVPRGLSPEETVKQIRARGGIAIIPHPYALIVHRCGLHSCADNLDADAIEVINGRNIIGDGKAFRLAERRGLGKTAGSDAHLLDEFGRCCTEVESKDKSINSILAAIKQGRTKVSGRHVTLWIMLKFWVLRRLRAIGLWRKC